jgi:hypothetical protein
MRVDGTSVVGVWQRHRWALCLGELGEGGEGGRLRARARGEGVVGVSSLRHGTCSCNLLQVIHCASYWRGFCTT